MTPQTIKIVSLVGIVAENKDIARTIRIDLITPALQQGDDVVLDFSEVTLMTQSFCHALISEVIRSFGIDILERISFAHCTPEVRGIVEIVVDYMQ